MSILLFGASGHLAQTKLIPRLYKAGYKDVFYVSRRRMQNNNWFTTQDQLPRTDVTYFSVNSNHLPEVISNISNNTRLCIEKPVGTDASSARMLIDTIISQKFHDVCYIDHYLCKYVPILSHFMIDVSQVSRIYATIHETADVEARIGSFSETGIVRDFIQNHILMVVAEMLSRELSGSRLGILNAI